ncbi:MAG: hypothetical protein ACPGJV_14300 [Bacteriovoracaceae bacterium]
MNQFNGPLKIAIIGFGSQAKAWSLNLKDSGHNVSVYTRKGITKLDDPESFNGIDLKPLSDLDASSDFYCLLIPDDQHLSCLKALEIDKAHFVLAHGYSEMKEELSSQFPHFQFSLLAPKAIASELRENYQQKAKLFGVIENHNNQSQFESLLNGLGITNKISSTFQAETIADLFSEQSLLCGLIPYAARKSFEKLTKNGISPEVAYIECWHEVKLIANAMIEFGPRGLFELISPNALLGAKLFSDQFFDENFEKKLEQTLQGIQSGEFEKTESSQDFKTLKENVLKDWQNSEIEKTFQKIGK